MRTSLPARLLPAVLVPLAACGGEPGNPSLTRAMVDAPEEIELLIPSDAVAFVQIESLDGLAARVDALNAAVDGMEIPPFDVLLPTLLANRVPVSAIDRTRPLGIAVSMPSNAFIPLPSFTAIVPAVDPDGLMASGGEGGAPFEREGDYVGIAGRGSYPREGSRSDLTAELPQGSVSVRVDLATVIEAQGGLLDEAFDEMAIAAANQGPIGGFDTLAVIEAYLELLETFVDSVDTLDVAIRTEGSHVALVGDLTAIEGSSLASLVEGGDVDLESTMGHVLADAPMVFLGSMDLEQSYAKFAPLVDAAVRAYPPNTREQMGALMEAWANQFPKMGDGFAGSFRLGPNGIRANYYLESSDSAGVLAALEEQSAILADLEGIELRNLGSDGTSDHLQWAFDPKKFLGIGDDDGPSSRPMGDAELEALVTQLYGGDGELLIDLVALDDGIAMAMGGDDGERSAAVDAIDRADAQASGPLADAIRQVQGTSAAMVLQFDIGQMAEDMARDLAPVLDGDPPTDLPSAPVTMYASASGRVWSGGLTVDLADLAAVADATRGR